MFAREYNVVFSQHKLSLGILEKISKSTELSDK